MMVNGLGWLKAEASHLAVFINLERDRLSHVTPKKNELMRMPKRLSSEII
jgi:hypothetical protein